ncbi:hypothetical protein [Micromonospora sp. NPDC003776]
MRSRMPISPRPLLEGHGACGRRLVVGDVQGEGVGASRLIDELREQSGLG